MTQDFDLSDQATEAAKRLALWRSMTKTRMIGKFRFESAG